MSGEGVRGHREIPPPCRRREPHGSEPMASDAHGLTIPSAFALDGSVTVGIGSGFCPFGTAGTGVVPLSVGAVDGATGADGTVDRGAGCVGVGTGGGVPFPKTNAYTVSFASTCGNLIVSPSANEIELTENSRPTASSVPWWTPTRLRNR